MSAVVRAGHRDNLASLRHTARCVLRLLREIGNAARRGVEVRLILQGEPDMPIAKFAARLLYDYLLKDGVSIHEYCQRPLHGKVALVDDDWSTVGSSNLDPLSLLLAREANVVVEDVAFAQELRARLEQAMQHDGRQVDSASYRDRPRKQRMLDAVAFGLMRVMLFLSRNSY